MTRTMRDSTNPEDIPADSEMVMGYVDGAYAWSGDGWTRFAAAVRVRCSVNAFGNVAEVLDVESGDATPQQVPGWVGRMRSIGVPRPTLYCDRANLEAIDQALHGAGVATTECALLVATLDGTTVTGTSPNGYPIIGCQDKGEAQTGGHYDESIIYDDAWPGSAPVPQPAPAPPTTQLGGDIAVKRVPINVPTDDHGNGFTETDIPWTQCVGAPFLNGSDPDVNADDAYWPGSAKAQERDGHVLVEVVGARPNTTEVVWQDVNEAAPSA